VNAMTTVYREEARHVGRLAFSMWNRDPASPSFGSFDRAYWGWKYKDFSDSTLQYALRLAVEYAIETGSGAALPELLEQYCAYCARLQHGDGSFDQCYPFEKSPGVLFDFLSTLVYARTSPLLTSSSACSTLDGVMARGVAFLLRTDEKHGRVANHAAQYAYELMHYAAHSGDERARRRGREYLERVLSWFDREEGWFLEYHGADTGYQSRTLRYLVKLAPLAPDVPLWEMIGQAAGFVEQTLMPDGSVHPMLGCRSSALLYASPFEALAARDARFHRLAAQVRAAWSGRRVPLPSELDFINALRLGDDALDAALAGAPRLDPPAQTALPRRVRYARAGLAVERGDGHAAYVSAAMGGTIVIYRRRADGEWHLAREDSGYLVRAPGGTDCWLTRVPGAGELVADEGDRLTVRARFHRSLHDELTPARMVLLRILNLTVLRSQRLGDWFRRVVVARLMGDRAAAALTLTREIAFSASAVTISDRVAADGAPGARPAGVLYRCRRVTGIHMASARYFQDQELDPAAGPWIERVADDPGREYAHSTAIDI
jgi:hypothetical protein